MTKKHLGKPTSYPKHYEPELLTIIPRVENRSLLGISEQSLPFEGADIWNAYEISCLDKQGKPLVFIGRFLFPADSPNLVESKSLKLYLNSLNLERISSRVELIKKITSDLSKAAGSAIEVIIQAPSEVSMPELPAGVCLDELEVPINVFHVNKELLNVPGEELYEEIIDEILFTNLFRSNCPVTNQPDWATVTVCYQGKKIPHHALLKYLVSYREDNDYHENCVERIFCDLMDVFNPRVLTVEANFLRRGGLDINPIRSTESGFNYLDFPRLVRQ